MLTTRRVPTRRLAATPEMTETAAARGLLRMSDVHKSADTGTADPRMSILMNISRHAPCSISAAVPTIPAHPGAAYMMVSIALFPNLMPHGDVMR